MHLLLPYLNSDASYNSYYNVGWGVIHTLLLNNVCEYYVR